MSTNRAFTSLALSTHHTDLQIEWDGDQIVDLAAIAVQVYKLNKEQSPFHTRNIEEEKEWKKLIEGPPIALEIGCHW